jgi:arylformamidase
VDVVEIFDLSVPVRSGMAVYPGDPAVTLERVLSIADGAAYNVSLLSFGVHTGTHVDAPVHIADGAAGADELPLDVLVGPATVYDATDAFGAHGDRVLLKTGDSGLDDDLAGLLVERGVRLVGVDYLTVGDEAVHHTLLDAGVVVLEGLDLSRVEPGEYELVCAPLKLVGADGAPARVFLLRE